MSKKKLKRKQKRQAPVIEALEPRILLSADLPGLDVPDIDPNDPHELDVERVLAQAEDAFLTAAADEAAREAEAARENAAAEPENEPELPLPSSELPDEVPRELIIVDPSVPEFELLLADVSATGDENTRLHVVMLDPQRSGIDQISEILASRSGLSAIHLISHGGDASIRIGGDTLDEALLQSQPEAISGWGGSLTEDGDILVYGCNVAETEAGRVLIDTLAEMTRADVAASNDLTGHSSLGGDWDLEYARGQIDSGVVIGIEAQKTWTGSLGFFTVNSTDDSNDANPGDASAVDGSGNISLRSAIEEANAGAGGDWILVPDGTYTLSQGALDIAGDITISGNGIGTTAIDADSLSRVFNVTSGTVTISNLTITGGGFAGVGGGLSVALGADVTLDGVELVGNLATDGGAISNAGTLDLTDVTIDGNTAMDEGGGIYNTGTLALTGTTVSNNSSATDGGGIWSQAGGAGLTLTNVTISGNTATGSGGGLYNAANATLQNVTITNNTATQGSGIHDTGAGATTTLTNTIVAGNLGSPDLSGSFVSNGGNLIGDTGTATMLATTGDQVGTSAAPIDARLGALADNGGVTKTHMLLTDSTAIDGGLNAGAPATDQAGNARIDGTADIGAYELGAPQPLDEFNAVAYDGNDGNQAWSGDWVEVGEADGAAAGSVLVESGQLAIYGTGSGGQGVYRVADLTGATTARLRLNYSIPNALTPGIGFMIEASADGSNWTTYGKYTVASGGTTNYDISAKISSTTYIRITQAVGAGAPTDVMYIDNVSIVHDGVAASSNTAPVFNDQALSVPEDAAFGTVVGAVVALDTDVSDTLDFSIVGGTGSGAFEIDNVTGEVKVTAPAVLDGSVSSFTLLVRATDDGIPAYSDDAIITINVTDVNDAPSFATDGGYTTTPVSASTNGAYDVVEQPDGKFVVSGYAAVGGNYDFAVARYNADGSLDTSFGTGGMVTTLFGTSTDLGASVMLQADGKIVVAGYTANGADYDFAIARYNSDGSMDTSFGGDGTVTTSFGPNLDFGNDVLVQADGKIVLAGFAQIGGNYDFAVARYNTDGSLDTGFGGDGMVTTAVGSGQDQGYSVAQQADGKLILAGSSHNGSEYKFTVVRYNTDGSVDTGFGTSGIATAAGAGGDDYANDVAIQSDGKIVVSGYNNSATNDFTVMRFNADGSLDSSFGDSGWVITPVGAGDDRPSGMTLQDDGKILVSGRAQFSDYDFAVVRYNNDGSLDTSFGDDGKVITDIANDDYGYGVVAKSDGTIVVTGMSKPGVTQDFALVKYNADGSLHTSFASPNALDGRPTFTQGGAAVVLDSDVTVFDEELSAADNFDGVTLTLVRSGAANADDSFSATGNLTTLVEGGKFAISGTALGAVTTNSGGTLVLTFEGVNVTQARINEVMQSIAYSNTSGAPPASVQIDWTFDDGNTGAQGTGGAKTATGSTMVSIESVNTGTAIWRESGSSTLEISDWDGSAFGAEGTAANVGSWRIMQGAESPVRDEKIVVGVDSGGRITGMAWDGSSWSALPMNDLATVSQSYWWGFDIQYESQSGDAVLVWANGSTGTDGISYATWDGSSWSAEQTLTAPQSGAARQIQLAADPNSDELVLIASNSSSQDYALVWNGSAWGSSTTLDSGTGDDRTDINIAYESESGEAIAVFGRGSSSLATAIWDGSGWSAPTAYAPPSGVIGDVRWTSVTSDPNSDRVAVGVITTNSEVWLSVWDGTTWTDKQLASTTSTGTTELGVSVAFESTSGELIATYGESGSSSVKYQTWSSDSGWSGEFTGPNIGAMSNSMTLSSDPMSDRIMLAVNDDNADVSYVLWDGSGWGTPTEHEVDSGETKNQPFLFLWGQSATPTGNTTPTTSGIADFSVNEDVGFSFIDLKVIFADAEDPDAALVYTISSNTNSALFDATTINGSGVLTLDYAADQNGSADITIRATDTGGLFVETTFTVNVNAVNDAPVLDNGGVMSLTPISEDDLNNSGNLVSEIIVSAGGDRITDADAGAVEGIAVTSLDSSNGTWQYNTGSGWTDIGTVSVSQSLLLGADDSLRFVPDGLNADTAFVTFAAWDQTTGTAGTKVDTSTFGGSTAFSSNLETAVVVVNAANDIPTAADNTINTLEDQPYTFALSDFGYSDVDGDAFDSLRVSPINVGDYVRLDGVVLAASTVHTVTAADIVAGKLTFHPPADTPGSASIFYFDVSDGSANSIPHTMSANVTPVNDAPVATADPGGYSDALSGLNPLSYWRLGDAGGGAVDAGSSTNDGTYNGGSLSQTGGLAGDADTSVRFNGTTDYLEIAHSSDYELDNGTVQLWFNADDVTGGDLQHLFSKDAGGFGTGGHLSIYLNTSGELEVRLQSASADYQVVSPAAVSAGEWHHVAFTFGTNGMELYLDGTLVDSDVYTGGLGTTSGGSGNADPIVIGAGTQNSADLVATPVNQRFTGLIDEVAILGSQLDLATVQRLYDAGFNHYTVAENGSLNLSCHSGCDRE